MLHLKLILPLLVLGAAGSVHYGGTLSVDGVTTLYDTILDAPGVDTNSPALSLRGDDSGTELEGTMNLAYGAQPYLFFSVDDDAATPTLTPVLHLDDVSIRPASDGLLDLGSQSNSFKDIHFDGISINAPGSQELSAGETLTITSSSMRLYSDGGAVVTTADPMMTNGTADGQTICLMGTSNANSYQILDETDQADSTLELEGGVAFTMGLGDRICFEWYAAGSKWFEDRRSAN